MATAAPAGFFWGPAASVTVPQARRARKDSNAFLPHPRPPGTDHNDMYQDVLRTMISCLRTELIPKKSEPFVTPQVKSKESISKYHPQYSSLRDQFARDTGGAVDEKPSEAGLKKAQAVYAFDRQPFNGKRSPKRPSKPSPVKPAAEPTWAEKQFENDDIRLRKCQRVLEVIEKEISRDVERETALMDCSPAKRTALLAQITQERAEAADWIMRTLERLGFVSTPQVIRYLQHVIEMGEKESEDADVSLSSPPLAVSAAPSLSGGGPPGRTSRAGSVISTASTSSSDFVIPPPGGGGARRVIPVSPFSVGSPQPSLPSASAVPSMPSTLTPQERTTFPAGPGPVAAAPSGASSARTASALPSSRSLAAGPAVGPAAKSGLVMEATSDSPCATSVFIFDGKVQHSFVSAPSETTASPTATSLRSEFVAKPSPQSGTARSYATIVSPVSSARSFPFPSGYSPFVQSSSQAPSSRLEEGDGGALSAVANALNPSPLSGGMSSASSLLQSGDGSPPRPSRSRPLRKSNSGILSPTLGKRTPTAVTKQSSVSARPAGTAAQADTRVMLQAPVMPSPTSTSSSSLRPSRGVVPLPEYVIPSTAWSPSAGSGHGSPQGFGSRPGTTPVGAHRDAPQRRAPSRK